MAIRLMERSQSEDSEKPNPEVSHVVFSRQTRRFQELFQEEMGRYGKPLGNTIASPKTVLSFAEDLMLCPTEAAVIIRLQRDREAARGCYIIAGDVASAADIGRALILIRVGSTETPFCLLAAVVRLRAQAAIEKYGNHWLAPEFRALDC